MGERGNGKGRFNEERVESTQLAKIQSIDLAMGGSPVYTVSPVSCEVSRIRKK